MMGRLVMGSLIMIWRLVMGCFVRRRFFLLDNVLVHRFPLAATLLFRVLIMPPLSQERRFWQCWPPALGARSRWSVPDDSGGHGRCPGPAARPRDSWPVRSAAGTARPQGTWGGGFFIQKTKRKCNKPTAKPTPVENVKISGFPIGWLLLWGLVLV